VKSDVCIGFIDSFIYSLPRSFSLSGAISNLCAGFLVDRFQRHPHVISGISVSVSVAVNLY